ncbi:MAG: glycosyl transferase family 90 [Bacteroidales bacterium]
MINNLPYTLSSGKNNKFLYYLSNYISYTIPGFIYRALLKSKVKRFHKKAETDPSLIERLNYYNKLEINTSLVQKNSLKRLSSLKKSEDYASVYYFDSFEYTRYFPQSLLWDFAFGDITHIPEVPSIVKSRPVGDHNRNSILMKLNKIRHFIFVKDNIPFEQKIDKAIFRGKVDNKESRIRFMQLYFGNKMCDLGNIQKRSTCPQEWTTPKMTIKEHLNYKFILALEGNDVASNLKWVMSSNSIAMMPKPTYETWFMEGKLIPNVHYIEIKEDYSDLEERMNYYINNPKEAQKIIDNANRYIEQFKNRENEELLSIMVLHKYFTSTGQL